MRTYYNLSDAYLGTLADVFDNPDSTSEPRGQRVREKFNYQFQVLNPKVEFIKTNDEERNVVIADYSQKEMSWYNSGDISVESASKISAFWKKLANPDGSLNSNYGYLVFKNRSHGHQKFGRVFVDDPRFPNGGVSYEVPKLYTPYEWSLEALRKDKDTRQAVMRFSLPEHFWDGNKDFTCTLHGFWSIRNGKLDLTINMRSNDMTLGLVYDAPWFVYLMYKMKADLIDLYPNLQIGTYTHFVHNIHVYDRDQEKVLKMLGRA